VDAGHGHWAIRRADGELVHLPARSTPLFILPEEQFEEQQVQLEPGDTLIVYSDGLVERDDYAVDLDVYQDDLDSAESADDLVRRLLGRMPAFLPDDVTVVVLRRLA
jgi:serine phosphatase RsbU (regulator of sigma subunit)